MRSKKRPAFLNPREMFILAEEFFRASRLLAAAQRAPGFSPADIVPRPNIMVHAVALELYLKCLYVLDHAGIPPRIHKLDTLFSSLSSDTQRRIQAHFDPAAGQAALDDFRRKCGSAVPLGLPPTFTFGFALMASSGAFEHVRFAYERKSRPTEQWHGEPLVRAARQAIIERNPEWKSAPTIGMSNPAIIL